MIKCPKCIGDLSDEERRAVQEELHPEDNDWRWNRLPEDQPLTRQEQRAWLRYVNRSWKPSRWDHYPMGDRDFSDPYPPDPILWALCKRREDAARRLLERKGTLSWEEGSLYAPWTLNWSLPLLKLILDLSPQAGELGCFREFICPGRTARVLVEGSLIIAAAALDDVAAVDLLLERGSSLGGGDAFEQGVFRALHEAGVEPFDDLNHFDRDRMKFPGLVGTYSFAGGRQWFQLCPIKPVSHMRKGPGGKGLIIECPVQEWSEGREILFGLNMDDAMAAACLCGNIRTLRRLLRYPPALDSLDFRNAISLMAAAAESEPLRACVRAVEEAVGMPIAQFVEPSEAGVGVRNSDFFVDCLRRHNFYGYKGGTDFVEYMVKHFGEGEWMEEAVRFVPKERLFAALSEVLPPMPDPDWASHPDRPVLLPPEILRGKKAPVPLMTAAGLQCALDRNTVSQDHDPRRLLELLDRAELAGQPSSFELSGAARCILRGMCADAERLLAHRAEVPEPLFQDERALAVLRQENPGLIRPFVNSLPFPQTSRLFLLSMLPLEREEGPYDAL